MMQEKSDWVLAVWVFTTFLWDVVCVGAAAYVVFWLNRSAWWFVLAILMCSSTTLFKILRKRYGIEEEEE